MELVRQRSFDPSFEQVCSTDTDEMELLRTKSFDPSFAQVSSTETAQIPSLGEPLRIIQTLDSSSRGQLERMRRDYASFRLGAARGMKGELTSTSLADTHDNSSSSVGSDLSSMADSDYDDGNALHAESPQAIPPPPCTSFLPPRRKNKSRWAPHVINCQCPETHDEYHTVPPASFSDRTVKVSYLSTPSVASGGDPLLLKTVLETTPKPKGRDKFSSVHVVAPPEKQSPDVAEPLVACLLEAATAQGVELHLHRLPERGCAKDATAMEEYDAIFQTASSAILAKADRASLLLYVGWEDHAKDAYAALIGMLPFRGISTALLTQRRAYGDLLHHATPSGVFQVSGRDAGRMGMFPVHAIFGALPSCTVSDDIQVWKPVDLTKAGLDKDPVAEQLPFKIGGLVLPMIMHNATYSKALHAFGAAVRSHFSDDHRFFPIVSCGESCDALGYGQDVLNSTGESGFLFTHKSGETYKRYDNYGSNELFASISRARAQGRTPVIIAVGGGVNGNSIGLIAAVTGADFMEVPTTPMHFNDATTSAKKAFSLVVDDRILSKNILGAFYLPKLVFCVNEMLLTSSFANIHATIGESTKTMNMLGMAGSSTGASDYHNILGASEFASNTISIIRTVGGFDRLAKFVSSPAFAHVKGHVLQLGNQIKQLRGASLDTAASTKLLELMAARSVKMCELRELFHAMPDEDKGSIKEFLTVVNREIVAAKAMFLAYSDPFEKYRALLFEYAHTLGHGVEAFANGLYARCQSRGIPVPESALRLHGQCVGMAVLWAGHMSFNLGLLEGTGLQLHQALGYLFNRHGGFSFQPLRDLCDAAGVDKAEFCEGVLSVVRRDNKRGYVASADPAKSVDQLVSSRPGKMMKSDDVNAELRYLVEVDEEWQHNVLCRAFDGEFDKVADLVDGHLAFVPSSAVCQSSSETVAEHVYKMLVRMYSGC